MKNVLFINSKLTFLILLILLLSPNQISYAQSARKVSFSKSSVDFSVVKAKNGSEYQKVEIKDLQLTGEPGQPNLPAKYLRLLIPADQNVADISVKANNREIINISRKVFPTQPDIPTSIHFKGNEFVEPDPYIYNSDKPWPENIIKVVNDGYFDGTNHIVTLEIYPMRYNPVSDYLEFYSEIEFVLNMTSSSKQLFETPVRKEKYNALYENSLRQLVDNDEDIPLYCLPKLNKNNSVTIGPLPAYEYVIITSLSLASSFDEFISWKRRKGLDIGIVAVEEIYTSYGGDLTSGIYDLPGKIREYLKDSWQVGTVWALLGGDYTVVPIRYGCGADNYWTSPTYQLPDDYKIPADLYFADFDGDWEVDGDEYTGEVTGDDPDYYPEIFVGRLLCTTSQEVQRWTTKLIKYEQNPGNGDTDYLMRSFLNQADELQNANQAVGIQSYLPGSFQHTVFSEVPSYNAPNPTFPLGSDIISELNNTKYGLWSWFNHGAPTCIAASTHLVNKTPRALLKTIAAYPFGDVPDQDNGLDILNNVNYPAIVYSIACEVTPFDDYSPYGWYDGYKNMGEGFTVITENGGPELLGNTRYGFVYGSYYLYQDFADLITAGTTNLGVAELISKANYCNDSLGHYHYLSYSHNLIGCPETQLWTDIPSTYEHVLITDNGSTVDVQAGVSGSTICASSADDNGASYFSVVENVAGATFSTDVRPLNITITKKNYLPYLRTLTDNYPPVISYFTQTPDPICLGSYGYVYAHLSQGTEPITYNWQGFAFPQNVTITPMGQKCKITYSNLLQAKEVNPVIQVPYYLKCTASNVYGSNSKNYTPHLSSDCEPSGCPTLAFNEGTERINENTLLINSPLYPDSIVVDYYLLNNSSRFSNSQIDFYINEPEKEHTWFDQIELWELKANKGEFIAVTDEGEFINFKDEKKPYKYVLNDTLDVTAELESNDGKIFYFLPGDLLRIEQSKGKLTSVVQTPTSTYAAVIGIIKPPKEEIAGNIYVIKKNSNGATITSETFGVGGFHLRENVSMAAKRIGELDEDDAVEIIFNNETELDYFVLTKNLKTVKSEKLELISSEKGSESIENKISQRDSSFAELLPGEEMRFSYSTKANVDKKEKIKLALKIVGRYETMNGESLFVNKDTQPKETTEIEELPKENRLFDNYPNPFNPTTTIKYELKETTDLTLKIYDSLGRLIKVLEEVTKPAGRYELQFNGSNLSSGIYFYQLKGDNFSFVKKMLLIK